VSPLEDKNLGVKRPPGQPYRHHPGLSVSFPQISASPLKTSPQAEGTHRSRKPRHLLPFPGKRKGPLRGGGAFVWQWRPMRPPAYLVALTARRNPRL
jgi:hypothetical protein